MHTNILAYLDICARKVVLGHNELLEVHIVGEVHARRVDGEDAPLGLLIRQRELDLAVDTPCIWEGKRSRQPSLSGTCT